MVIIQVLLSGLRFIWCVLGFEKRFGGNMSFPGEALIAGTVGGAFGYAGTKATNQANREMAREQMAFQERMSNTAYQRSVEDMRKAGINPILAAGVGGASSPGGAMATMQNEMGSMASSAISAARMVQDLKQSKLLTQIMQSELAEKRATSAIYDSAFGVPLKVAEKIGPVLSDVMGLLTRFRGAFGSSAKQASPFTWRDFDRRFSK